MATGGENPARVYINLSTSANGSSVFAALDPTASYRESRSQPIVADISQYKFGVVRVNLTGNRNFPLLIPDIKAGQPNPWLTNYQMTISLACKELGAVTINTVTPVATTPKYFGIRTYVNDVLENEDMVSCYDFPGPALNSAAAVAASLQEQIRAGGVVRDDPVLKNIIVTVSGSTLMFSSPDIEDGSLTNWRYTVEPGADGSMLYFGFLNTFPQVALMNDYAGNITLPFPCSYTLTVGAPGTGILSCTQNMIWETQEPFQPTPPPPIPAPQPSQAYWLYDYSWFVSLFQKQINRIWSGPTSDGSLSIIQQAALANPDYTIPSKCPIVRYDVDKRRFVLEVDGRTVGKSSNGNVALTVTLNETFANLLAWGGGTYDSSGAATLGFQNATYPPGAETGESVLFTSEYSATGNGWSPVGAILFTTGLFPTRAEIVSAPHVQGADGLIGGFNSTADTSQVISDVINPASDASDYNAYPIIYVPTLIRWCDMPSGRRLLDIIDFKLKWRNGITNEENEIYLNPGSFFSAKVILQRRDISDA